MATTKVKTPNDLLLKSLSGRPQGTRCVLVVEPDQLLDWPRTVTDTKGRVWDVVIYRGDDIVTRRAWQRAWGGERPICFVLSRPIGNHTELDASSVADLVGRAEGDIVDLSMLGFFHSLIAKVNPPPSVLLEYKHEFVENAERILKVYPRFKERWGEPDSWGRGHVLAILTLARFPGLDLDDVWCNEMEPVRFAAHACWLLCHSAFSTDDLRMVADAIWESSRSQNVAEPCGWLRVPPEELDAFRAEMSAYLVLRDLLSDRVDRHLDTLLKAKLSLRTLNPEVIGPMATAIARELKEHSRWQQVKDRSREFLESGAVAKVADLLGSDPAMISRIVSSPDTAPNVQAFLVRQAVMERCEKGVPWPLWVETLLEHPLVLRDRRHEAMDEAEAACAALMSAAGSLAAVEKALQSHVQQFSTAEELLDWYVGRGLHLLELRVADAFAKLEVTNDRLLQTVAYSFTMEAPKGLRFRVRDFLNALDRWLAAFVAADPQKFQQGPRSAIRVIPNLLRGGKHPAKKRVWVIVMDGMRYDTWDAVVRPLLLQHFEIVGEDQPYFSLLPSKTDIARRGLLAGNLGKDWRDFFHKPTKDERVLAARALGISKQDFNSKVVFVGDAQTTEARNQKLGYNADEVRDVNVLIYPISDDLGHYHNDTLASLNEQIRGQLRTQQGRRGIIDDLRWRVKEGDLLLVTSDHGFQELFPHECVRISRLDAKKSGATDEDVVFRYLRFKPSADVKLGDHVPVEWEELGYDGKKQTTSFTLSVGGTWFQREKGKPARFAHGGLSLAEVTIPGVLLRRIEEKAARIELIDVPSELVIEEDRTALLEFEIVNTGNVDCNYELSVTTNLGERLVAQERSLAAGKREQISCRVHGRYTVDLERNLVPNETTTAILLELSHTDVKGKLVRPAYGRDTVGVKVKPKPTKIDTDALKAFDNL